MRGEQVDTLHLPLTGTSADSIIRPVSLFEKKVSVREEFLFDTITPATGYTDLWKDIPLKGQQDVDFMSGVLLYTIIFLGLLAFIRLRGKGMFSSLFSFFFKQKNQEKIYTEGLRPNYFFLFLTFCLSASVLSIFFVYVIRRDVIFDDTVLVFTLFAGYHLFLIGFIRLLGWTFNARHCAKEMVTNLWVYNTVIGLMISPFVIALFYVRPTSVQPLIYFIFTIFSIYLIFRFIRLIKILFEYRVSILYMILYLCALEILPFLVLYKMLEEIIEASVN
ncbi:DUF4271 domain-containing protein [uncultured Sanguibacteroides sp.]|uniref:DUF4271 domain-containing protein n=1 Tax=uncultured Sanguibacteroides sp. TaxID=1635151 RepID=UPI0025FE6EBB|nr:DUF4271 domain-containing protein [uncultured Sanguibacteroides sp.]